MGLLMLIRRGGGKWINHWCGFKPAPMGHQSHIPNHFNGFPNLNNQLENDLIHPKFKINAAVFGSTCWCVIIRYWFRLSEVVCFDSTCFDTITN
jgi:hypothetical protein